MYGVCTPYVCVYLRHDDNNNKMNACMICIIISQIRKCLLMLIKIEP